MSIAESVSQATLYDVVVVGAGPAGLSCAIEAKKKGLSYLVLDKGSVVDAIRRFPLQMTFFSTPELLEIGNIPFIVPTFRPSRTDAVRYYQRVSKEYDISVRTGAVVDEVRRIIDVIVVRTKGFDYRAKNVVIATGYFDSPAAFNVPGSNNANVLRYYSEPFPYSGKRIAVVGGKNSAVEIALDLFRNGASVTLIHRGQRLSDGIKYWVLPDIENRIKSGEITALFETTVREITPDSLILEGKNARQVQFDFLFVIIGYQPDTKLLESAGVAIDAQSCAPIHDPTTMETNIPGIYVAGSIAAGKFNNKIFIENGRAHGALIVKSISKK